MLAAAGSAAEAGDDFGRRRGDGGGHDGRLLGQLGSAGHDERDAAVAGLGVALGGVGDGRQVGEVASLAELLGGPGGGVDVAGEAFGPGAFQVVDHGLQRPARGGENGEPLLVVAVVVEVAVADHVGAQLPFAS